MGSDKSLNSSMQMWQQRIGDIWARQPTTFDPFPGIICSSFNQLPGAGKVVGRYVKWAQTGDYQNLDRTCKLLKIAYDLIGDEQRNRMQRSCYCAFRRLLKVAGKSRGQNDDPSGAEFSCGK